MIMPSFVTPATGLARAAMGVFCNDTWSMRCWNPVASLTIKGRTASGVTSLVEKPVPPVVTQSAIPLEDHSWTCFWIAGISSGAIA